MSGKKRRSNHMITLISLLCIAVLLIVCYLLYTNHKEKKEEEAAAAEEEATNTSFLINEEDSTKYSAISIETSEGVINLVQENEIWEIQGEDQFPLDEDKVTQMAETLAQLSASKTVVESAEELSEFGLSEPSVVVTATRTDGTKLVFNIGDQLTVDTDYYASIGDGTTVYVVPIATYKKFDIVKNDLFLIPQSLSLTTDNIKEVQLSTKTQGNFHIIHDDENPYDYTGMNKYTWYSTDSNRYPVNVDDLAVSTVLNQFLSYSIDSGVDYGEDAMKAYGLDDPQGMIYLRYVDSDDSSQEIEYVLHVGNQDESGDYYVSINDDQIIYKMLASQLSEKLTYKESDIVSSFIHLVDMTYVSNMQIMTSRINDSYDFDTETTTDADGNENSESIFKKNGVVMDSTEFRKLYNKVISLTKSGFLEEDEAMSGTPILTIEFNLTNGNKLTACYYEYDTNNYGVTLNGKPQFTASKKDIDEFIESL